MRIETSSQKINSVAIIGNYLPRKCGIATFTTDLVQTLSSHSENCRCKVITINDNSEGYNYPKEVRFEINQHNLAEYSKAAEFLNINQVDIVSLQHEFGIFGGPDGQYILQLLQELQMPVVTTLHTVLVEPSKKQKVVMEQLIDRSARLVVMSQTAVNILHTLYDIPKEKIVFIPHGIPDMPFVDPNYYKDKFDLLGQKVLLTFGLLSENKGIEYVIKALPSVVKEIPNLTYVVLGATHPNVLKSEGEKYRRKLEYLVQKLNLQDHVIFKNHFVPFEELCENLASADLYITPYNNEDQITSGTLAYASGTGKAVISTPYWYAKEMLSDGRGILVPFKNAEAIADAITGIFSDDAERHQMRKRAYDFNRKSTWKEIGRQYNETFQNVMSEQQQFSGSSVSTSNTLVTSAQKLPRLKLNHLLSLTDDTGLLQHATYTIANREFGYCTDDNSRALIVSVRAQHFIELTKREEVQLETLSNRYLSFLLHAYNNETGRFRNFMDYSRQWVSPIGSEDAHSRALWSLGITVNLSRQKSHRPLTSTLFMRALEAAEFFESPRAIAFALLGVDSYLKSFAGDSKARRIGGLLAERLYNQFKSNESEDWPWLENILTYSNGKIPHGLLLAGKFLERDDMIQRGLQALDWLINIQTVNGGHLSPVGNHGWYVRGRKKANFDQQPLEANCLIEACIAAFEITGNKQWLNRAFTCFNWFLGYNDLKLPLYDDLSGGCRDGLLSGRVNQNQGAESTLAWLLSLTAMSQLKVKDDEPIRLSRKENHI